MVRENKNGCKKSIGEKVFDIVNVTIMILLIIVTLYPFLYVAFASISDPAEIMSHRGLLLYPKGFSLGAYRLVFQNPMISVGYKNTLFYVVVGTAINIFMTSLGAYVLSRKNVYWNKYIMFIIAFTMFFNGGLIPFYLLVRGLGLANTRWSLIIPSVISTYNLIVMRTSFAAIPVSLEESARIDGAKDWTILWRIIMPLSMPVVSVMILFYAVGHWNQWFHAMVFLRNRELYPLQLILREILITNSMSDMLSEISVSNKELVGRTVQYATIMVVTIPILFVYPFLQKYFVKGVMIGALKG